jgi:hypothetical protein
MPDHALPQLLQDILVGVATYALGRSRSQPLSPETRELASISALEPPNFAASLLLVLGCYL